MNRLKQLLLFSIILTAAGCHGIAPIPGVKVGKPYTIAGKTYYPEYDPTYDKIGMASWYGPGFHGKYTASGEIYNQYDLTAAHPTLPMPSLVRVTNLSNGKSLIVRINDRGPFKRNRIIDLSKKAAQELGIRSTSEVRVQYLKTETEIYLASLDSGKQLDMATVNADAANARTSSVMHSTEPGDQIVEADESSSNEGEAVTKAAPVMSVASDELTTPSGSDRVTPASYSEARPVILSRAYAAEENAEADIPRQQAPASPFKPQEAKTSLNTSNPSAGRKEPIQVGGTVPGNFYIQAGSFASEENAHKLSGKLQNVSSVDIGKVEMGSKTWWRVRLGPFASRADAATALDKVHQTGVPDARIVNQ